MEQLGISYATATDFWPHGEVAQKYGVFNAYGTANRAIFLIDREGMIRFKGLYGEDELPPVEPVLKELRQL